MTKIVRLALLLAVMSLASSLLAGCWDFRDVHQMTYGSVIGVDYRNNEYVLYMQAMDFENIAQREGIRPPKHRSVIGKATGTSLANAMFNLYRTETQPIYWGHIGAIIFSRQAMAHIKIEALVDTANRFRVFRYNVWVFGTDEPIERLMSITPYFGYSPFDSRLLKPLHTYTQFSNIKPVYLHRFISDYFERGKSVLLPQLGSDASSWKESGENMPQLKIEGVYVFCPGEYRGRLTEEQIQGLRYIDTKSVRMPVTVFKNGKPAALMVVNKPSIRMSHTVTGGRIRFDIRIRVAGYMDEMLQDVTRLYAQEQVQKTIEREVRETFDNGKKINADVMNLMTPLYRYHYATWRKFGAERLDMQQVELGRVQVDYTVLHTGKYKARLK